MIVREIDGQEPPLGIERLLAGPVSVAEALRRARSASPQELADHRARAKRERAELRAATAHVPLTLDALLDKMGWSNEYAEHLVQPYCECEDGVEGWERCPHAQDLGLY